MSVWEKHKHGWLRRSPYPDSGVGDFIYNTCTKHVIDNDNSDWARLSFLYCEKLLIGGYRWPEEFGEIYGKRRRDDLSWDPLVGYAVCAKFMDFEIIAEPPWYLWPPSYWVWWKRLKRDNRQDFVKRLSYFQAYANTIVLKKITEDFYK